MIPRTPVPSPRPPTPAVLSARPVPAWQRSWANAVTGLDELLQLVGLEPGSVPAAIEAGREFPLRVPRGFVARMRRGDPHDPLLRQVLPIAAELAPAPGFSADPLAEARAAPTPGLLHKYHGRALLVATGACAVHCRYCFRRHFPYGEHQPWGEAWEQALAYIAADPTLEEVLLSGGDPLSLDDRKLDRLVREIAAIPHVQRLRVHSRLPVVLPERVDDGLLAWLTGTRLIPVLVIHANHGNEIDAEVEAATRRLREVGVTVLNQSVLLRGVNDRVEALAELSRKLFAGGVLPYYLHLLDRVAGAAHFGVSPIEARELMRRLTAELPGYLVPRLVREVPGKPAKLPVDLEM